MATTTKQDTHLASAAVALYRAAHAGCSPEQRDSDECLADECIRVVTDFIECFHYCAPDDPQAIAVRVYTQLNLDLSKIH